MEFNTGRTYLWRWTGLSFIVLVSVVLLTALFPFAGHAQTELDINMTSEVPFPEVVRAELLDLLTDTINEVVLYGFDTESLAASNLGEVGEALRTGINIIIEPKGYTIPGISLSLTDSTLSVDLTIYPFGWTPEDSQAVESVDIVIAQDRLDRFWLDIFQDRIDDNIDQILPVFEHYLLGLPVLAVDPELSTGIVMPYLEEANPGSDLFPDFNVSHEVEIGNSTTVTIHLEPVNDVIELIRPRMYSLTLYNVILERLSERVVAEADFLEGMPKSEILPIIPAIEDTLAAAVEEDVIARRLHAYVSLNIDLLPDEPTVRINATVESRQYDLSLETMVDFGNEERDTAEIQGRFGFLFARGIEVFVNLNFFTNDSALETDIALGLRPGRGTFAGIGYDLEREAIKYFIEQEISRGFRLRGEIFEDDTLNEFGMTYVIQQYVSAGVFTNGDNEYWLRAIFML